MHTARFASALAVLALAVTACGEADTTAPLVPQGSRDATVDLPTLAAASNGATIDKDETLAYFINFDADRGLVSVHGAVVPICQGNPATPLARTVVTTPSQVEQRLVFLGGEDEPVVIYRSETGQVSCDLVLSQNARVGEGLVRHDQVYSLASFKSTWRGVVTAPDGSTHHYTEVYQLTGDLHDPNNPDLWSLNTAQILVH